MSKGRPAFLAAPMPFVVWDAVSRRRMRERRRTPYPLTQRRVGGQRAVGRRVGENGDGVLNAFKVAAGVQGGEGLVQQRGPVGDGAIEGTRVDEGEGVGRMQPRLGEVVDLERKIGRDPAETHPRLYTSSSPFGRASPSHQLVHLWTRTNAHSPCGLDRAQVVAEHACTWVLVGGVNGPTAGAGAQVEDGERGIADGCYMQAVVEGQRVDLVEDVELVVLLLVVGVPCRRSVVRPPFIHPSSCIPLFSLSSSSSAVR